MDANLPHRLDREITRSELISELARRTLWSINEWDAVIETAHMVTPELLNSVRAAVLYMGAHRDDALSMIQMYNDTFKSATQKTADLEKQRLKAYNPKQRKNK